MKNTNEDVLFLLRDERNCKSNNLQQFFRSDAGRKMSNYLHIIRFEGELWFATLGWLARGEENGFAGVRVVEAAFQGGKAQTGYPNWQKGGDYEDVTEWFWAKYRERGKVAIPEIWRIQIPRQRTHAEAHYL